MQWSIALTQVHTVLLTNYLIHKCFSKCLAVVFVWDTDADAVFGLTAKGRHPPSNLVSVSINDP